MRRGFTLVEIIVVVGIVALIAAVALANFPAFRGRLALDRQAGTLALGLRTAQQFSTGVRRFEGYTFTTSDKPASCSELFEAQFPAYALSIDMADPNQYRIVADPDCDRISDTFPGDTISENALENNVHIQELCTNIDNGTSCNDVGKLDVWFIRPSPTVLFTVDGTPDPSVSSAKIIMGLDDGSRRSVVIRTTGQISIQNEQ